MTPLFLLAAAAAGLLFAAVALFVRWRLPDRLWSILPVVAIAAVMAVAFLAAFEPVLARVNSPADFDFLRNFMRGLFGVAFAGTALSIHRRAAWVERNLLIESLVGMGTFLVYVVLGLLLGLLLLQGNPVG